MIVNRITTIVTMVGCLVFFSTATSAAPPSYRVHYSLVNSSKPRLPRRIIVLPVSIEVSEKTFGGVTEVVDAWSEKASDNIFQALGNYTKRKKGMRLVRTPRFSSAENAKISEHLALYRQVVNAASWSTRTAPVWKHKLKKFDYSIGPGLNFLRKKTSADTALLVYGEDEVSTAGRKAKATVAKIFGGTTQYGYSYIHVGLVDLRTGNLLWLNSEFKSGASDLRKAKDAQRRIDNVFKKYPGIEKYRKAYVK